MRRLRLGLWILLAVGCGIRTSTPAAAPGQASGAPCATAKDCARATATCFVAVCDDGVCETQVAPAGTVPEDQKAGDCQELVCDGKGQAIPRDDQNDTPASDDNDCTEERCAGGAPDHAALAAGEACGQGGICNGSGVCGVCIPGKRRCEGNAAEACEDRGQWSDPAACQGAEPVCSQGACAGIASLGLGAHHACVALSDGTARCWGANRARQIEGQNRRRVPIGGVIEIAIGDGHTCARISGGGVKCWGSNEAGELGDGSGEDQPAPVDVIGLHGAAQIAAGTAHTCARLEDSTVVCWGKDQLGQLGDGGGGSPPPQSTQPPSSSGGRPSLKMVPTKITLTGPSPMIELVLGGDRTCARYADLSAECWGAEESHRGSGRGRGRTGPVHGGPHPHGGPGHGGPAPAAPPAPASPPKFKLVRGLKGVTQIALGGDHTCARMADGSVQCWGDNAKGQLGDGTTSARHTPTKIRGIAGAVEIALGRDHTCARMQDATVQCWGANGSGQLGDGSKADRKTPAPVPGLAGVVSLVAAGDHTCARLGSGEVKCWGDNGDGALGDGTMDDRAAPAAVAW